MVYSLLALLAPIKALTSNFYIADLFDVFIVTAFIYAALLLFKQTRSFSILAGIGIIVILYVLAQAFDFYLTSLFLRSFFGAFFIVLVIIFQEEFRRFFESIALWGKRRPREPTSQVFDAIIHAVASLAHKNTGALIVIAGHENFGRHIEGGEVLDGVVSDDLLESIFDPTSPGHDGAVIIDRNRISLFGAHLPLSHNLQQIGKHGTRHAAAVGITECSDALAIVISEEQGTLSIAQRGALTALQTIDELRDVLRSFLKEKFPATTLSVWETIVKKNSLEKIFALCIAVLLWLFLAYRAETVQRDFALPISYRNIKEELVIEESRPKTITVTLASRGNVFETLDPKSFEISIDARDLTPGTQKIVITEEMIKHPLNVSVINIAPRELSVTIAQYKTVVLPVEVVTKGQPARGFIFDRAIASPGTVSLLIPKNMAPPPFIATEPIDISGLREPREFEGTLNLPQDARLDENATLEISITIVVRKK